MLTSSGLARRETADGAVELYYEDLGDPATGLRGNRGLIDGLDRAIAGALERRMHRLNHDARELRGRRTGGWSCLAAATRSDHKKGG